LYAGFEGEFSMWSGRIRSCALATWIALSLLAATGAARADSFGLDQIAARAEQLAKEPYLDRRKEVPDWMLIGKTSYDQWRDIRFRPAEALWRAAGLPFQVQFFHPGLYYGHSVTMNVVEDGKAREVPFSTKLFDYGKNDFAARIPADIGYAGFRVHYPIKTPQYFDEVIVFLGASYFRAIGRDQLYGLSARGLAVDTVTASAEEFPNFTEFWLVKPPPGALSLLIYALLEGPSATGAYAFTVTPGEQTQVDVEARLFFRRKVERLGIAPLTSMFFFDENGRHCFDDFRPEVHDSDGLLLHFDGGEWLWRPLANPRSIAVNGFQMRDPRGFGLIQRDRDFANHQDLETHAELRPSAWIVPRGDWGEGRVELVEIPTDTEKNDNIVAFWVPAVIPGPGEQRVFSYSLYWYGADAGRPPGGRAIATRQDAGTIEGARRFVVDFAGGTLAAHPSAPAPEAVVSANEAEVKDIHLVYNPAIAGWRLGFQVVPEGNEPVEMRAYLRRGDDVLTETWSYAYHKGG
jgi:periplasmic glucans biosynthesis protein